MEAADLLAELEKNNQQALEGGGADRLAPLDVDKEWATLQAATEGVNVKLTLLPKPCTLAALQAELKQG